MSTSFPDFGTCQGFHEKDNLFQALIFQKPIVLTATVRMGKRTQVRSVGMFRPLRLSSLHVYWRDGPASRFFQTLTALVLRAVRLGYEIFCLWLSVRNSSRKLIYPSAHCLKLDALTVTANPRENVGAERRMLRPPRWIVVTR